MTIIFENIEKNRKKLYILNFFEIEKLTERKTGGLSYSQLRYGKNPLIFWPILHLLNFHKSSVNL